MSSDAHCGRELDVLRHGQRGAPRHRSAPAWHTRQPHRSAPASCRWQPVHNLLWCKRDVCVVPEADAPPFCLVSDERCRSSPRSTRATEWGRRAGTVRHRVHLCAQILRMAARHNRTHGHNCPCHANNRLVNCSGRRMYNTRHKGPSLRTTSIVSFIH
jgi:hypothetical protein